MSNRSSASSIRENNFDLIRLLAALQVVFMHADGHLKVGLPAPFLALIDFFPGVPIFFVISGFLISLSWERAPSLRQYAWNRGLRIYPALWVCFLVSMAIILGCGVKMGALMNSLAWILAQLTIFQFYNPKFLRGFGIGVINGSLWTIVVELQFYVLLPLLAVAAKKNRSIWIGYALAAAVMTILSKPYISEWTSISHKLLSVSIIPWLFYFLVGVIARQVYVQRPELFKGKCIIWGGIYALWAAIELFFQIEGRAGGRLNVASIVLLAMLIISLAYSKANLSSSLLKGNDISYGVYLYHIPLLNWLVFHQIVGLPGFIALLASVLVVAALSWRMIEKPALALKGYSLR